MFLSVTWINLLSVICYFENVTYNSASCVKPERGLSMFTAQLSAMSLISYSFTFSHHLFTTWIPSCKLKFFRNPRAAPLFTASSGGGLFEADIVNAKKSAFMFKNRSVVVDLTLINLNLLTITFCFPPLWTKFSFFVFSGRWRLSYWSPKRLWGTVGLCRVYCA